MCSCSCAGVGRLALLGLSPCLGYRILMERRDELDCFSPCLLFLYLHCWWGYLLRSVIYFPTVFFALQALFWVKLWWLPFLWSNLVVKFMEDNGSIKRLHESMNSFTMQFLVEVVISNPRERVPTCPSNHPCYATAGAPVGSCGGLWAKRVLLGDWGMS